jgi:transposase
MLPVRAEVVLDDEEREVLERWARRPTSAQALALRCRIVLAAADGEKSIDIAERLGCTRSTVGRWRGRFAERGLDGLNDEPRPGKPRQITDEDIEAVIVKTLEEQPKNTTHWSTRSMAAATGMSQTAVSRIWRAFGLKPHRTEHFKLSPDPQFIDKVRDIVGLYLNPPEAAVVLGVDEKSQVQALDRSSPVLPLMPGVPERHTHDYVRHGTTNLYAALDVASGQGDRRHDPSPPCRGVPQVLEPGRALVRRADHQVAEAQRPPLRPRPRRLHPHLDHELERGPQALRLAQERRRDPRQPRCLLPADQRLRSLAG